MAGGGCPGGIGGTPMGGQPGNMAGTAEIKTSHSTDARPFLCLCSQQILSKLGNSH